MYIFDQYKILSRFGSVPIFVSPFSLLAGLSARFFARPFACEGITSALKIMFSDGEITISLAYLTKKKINKVNSYGYT